MLLEASPGINTNPTFGISTKDVINKARIKIKKSALWWRTFLTAFAYPLSIAWKNLVIPLSIMASVPSFLCPAILFNFKYFEARTGTRIIATAKEQINEKTIVNVNPEKIWPTIPRFPENITKGKKTQIVVSVLDVIALIISWEPKTAATEGFAPLSR